MRTQSTSAVIDRSVERARAARGRTDWRDERAYVAQLGETTFRDLKQRAFAYAARWEHVYAARPRFDLARMDAVYPDDGGGAGVPTREDFQGERASKPPPPATSAQQPQAQAQAQEGNGPNPTGQGVLTVGGWMLGIGALLEVGGLVLYFGPGASISALQILGGLMCIYVGPALLVASLLVLVIGAVMTFAVPAPKSAPPSETTPSAAPSSPQI